MHAQSELWLLCSLETTNNFVVWIDWPQVLSLASSGQWASGDCQTFRVDQPGKQRRVKQALALTFQNKEKGKLNRLKIITVQVLYILLYQ